MCHRHKKCSYYATECLVIEAVGCTWCGKDVGEMLYGRACSRDSAILYLKTFLLKRIMPYHELTAPLPGSHTKHTLFGASSYFHIWEKHNLMNRSSVHDGHNL